jgi:hypothetical protein
VQPVLAVVKSAQQHARLDVASVAELLYNKRGSRSAAAKQQS